jgi:hypothetical protein
MKLNKQNLELVHQFAKHCIKELGLKGKIKITLSKHQTGMPTAGYYSPEDSTVFVAVHNRAIADVMRTLSHELTHCQQKQQGIVFPHDDEGLQQYEDAANVSSGKLVRFWGRKHKEIYSDLLSEGLERILYTNRSPKP